MKTTSPRSNASASTPSAPPPSKPPVTNDPREGSALPSVNYGDEIACFDNQRLFLDGTAFRLVTDFGTMEIEDSPRGAPGQTVQTLTREQVRSWLDQTVIGQLIPPTFRADFRHHKAARTPAAALALGEVLSSDSIGGLNRLGAEGIDFASQVSGAVASWLQYAEELRALDPDELTDLKAAPGVLDCFSFARTHARARADFITERGCRFYRELLKGASHLPLQDAAEYLDGLADLIEHNPALADEYKNLREFGDNLFNLGRSEAIMKRVGEK